jgi:PmbA protein
MIMIPDDALERLMNSANKIGQVCEKANVTQWEVYATQGYGHSLDFEAGKIAMASGGGDGGFGIRVVENGRYGYAHLVDIGNSEKAVAQALSIARKSPSIKGFNLPANQDAVKVEGMFDKELLNIDSEMLLEQGDQLLAKATELDSRACIIGGGIGISAGVGAIITSSGIEAGGSRTSHGVGVQLSIDEDGLMTSSYEGDTSRFELKNLDSSVEKAVHWAQVTREQISGGDTEDCPVLMTNNGVTPLFSVVVPAAVTGERLVRGESFWSGMMGQSVMADHLNLVDDGRMEGGLASGSRDDEGIPTRRQTLVENGKLKGQLWSTRSAAKQVSEGRIDQAISTGSASRGGHTSPPGCSTSDLILSSSKTTMSRERLIEEMDSGYIVHSVMGAHTANPTSGDFSVTTSAILKVENGEVIGALSQAGFSGNLAKAFTGRVILGDCSDSTTGSLHIPDILFMDGLRINPA